jgi:glucose/arabinose dehydrogenase
MTKLSGSLVPVVALALFGCSKGTGTNEGAAGAGGSATTTAPAAGGGGSAGGADAGKPNPACSGAVRSTAAAGPKPPAIALTVPSGFTLTPIASVPKARQLAALPNGDLLVASNAQSLYLIPNADASVEPGAPVVFATPGETSAQGLAFDPGSCLIYLSSEHDIYAMPYRDGQTSAAAGTPIAHVRTGSISSMRPPGDTDNHTSTSVAFAGGTLYAATGSSCNACVETDPTRAAIQRLDPNGGNMAVRATRFRNAIALAENPATGTLWAGGAGQDNLAANHPFEFFDAVTLHAGVADYGWPSCEENHVAYTQGAPCAATVAPLVELPAYATLIGAAFYPAGQAGAHAFPAAYRGGVFLSARGSWHKTSAGTFVTPPMVVYVPMDGDKPKTPVDWSDPTKQWTTFVGGFQLADGTTRIARPTGLAVGPLGSLFIAEDQNGTVYRVRPM